MPFWWPLRLRGTSRSRQLAGAQNGVPAAAWKIGLQLVERANDKFRTSMLEAALRSAVGRPRLEGISASMSAAAVELSIVIPGNNEEPRLPASLAHMPLHPHAGGKRK